VRAAAVARVEVDAGSVLERGLQQEATRDDSKSRTNRRTNQPPTNPQIPMPEVIESSNSPFVMTEVPIDWPMWLEQGFDPSHGPFLHHGLAGLKMQDNQPMPAEPLPLSQARRVALLRMRRAAPSLSLRAAADLCVTFSLPFIQYPLHPPQIAIPPNRSSPTADSRGCTAATIRSRTG
jgi:hypothetical protein